MKSRIVRQILDMGTGGASVMVVVVTLASVKFLPSKSFPVKSFLVKSRLWLIGLANALCQIR